MHYKRVIPCLDVNGGRVVKGVGFLDLRDAGDPVELAARYDAAGADELVFLDITATSDKRATVVELARQAADELFIPFTIGGGIRSVAEAQAVGVPVIASGGAGRLEDLADAVQAGADALLVASILHYGHHTVDEVKRFLADSGIAVRARPARDADPAP